MKAGKKSGNPSQKRFDNFLLGYCKHLKQLLSILLLHYSLEKTLAQGEELCTINNEYIKNYSNIVVD